MATRLKTSAIVIMFVRVCVKGKDMSDRFLSPLVKEATCCFSHYRIKKTNAPMIQCNGFYRSRKVRCYAVLSLTSPATAGRDLNFIGGSQKSQIKGKRRPTTFGCSGQPITLSCIPHSICELCVYCVESAPQTIGLRWRSLRSSSLHQDNELSWPDKEAAEKNGGRWWWVSADLRDPDQAGTEAAELDTTVVTLR